MALPEPTRALIVEDDPVVARSVARRLLREGYTVSIASTCRAARAAGTGFQIGILDPEPAPTVFSFRVHRARIGRA